MSLTAFVLVFIAACCHATWNFLVKRIDGGPELVWLFSAVAAVLYLPVAVFIYLQELPSFGPGEIAAIVLSVLLHLGYFLLLQQGYRKGDLSLVYPTARATGPFLSSAFAVLILGEHMTPQILVGGIAIIVGVMFLTGGFRSGAKPASASLLFGIAAGTLIGSYTVWDAYTVTALAVPPLLLDYASSLGRLTLLAPYAARHRALVAKHWHQHRGAIIIIAIVNPLAYILVLYALTFTPVVYVAPTRELSVLIGVLLGSIFLKEGHLKHRLIWATVILTGVTLLATG